MVEEIEDLKKVCELEGEMRAVVSCYGKKIEEMIELVVGYEKKFEVKKNVVLKCEKEVEECRGEARSLKNILVCGLLANVVIYYCVLA